MEDLVYWVVLRYDDILRYRFFLNTSIALWKYFLTGTFGYLEFPLPFRYVRRRLSGGGNFYLNFKKI